METNKIYNEDCSVTMDRMKKDKVKVDVVLTSPPYNTSRGGNSERAINNHEARYDKYSEDMSDGDYIEWSVGLFNKYDEVLGGEWGYSVQYKLWYRQ